ncbi:hypothetical protein DEM27_00640 [Metarhizobium album]|uniref:Uncharacterized protein n=1 Tax=Metarhizobium album TaxID=2182425 RepID=A0A2U2DWP5_9HYPH|nr:hypothetical protein DEM27_00640 [Rhizobium album]
MISSAVKQHNARQHRAATVDIGEEELHMGPARSGKAVAWLAVSLVCVPLEAGAQDGAKAAMEVLKQTPVSVLTYGLSVLRQDFRYAFSKESGEVYADFVAPLSGKVGEIATVIYDAKTETILLNLVKVEKIDEGATPDEACRQAMAAMRSFAGVDPATGKLQPGMESTTMSNLFYFDGTAMPEAVARPAELDGLFRLRFHGRAGNARFRCDADLLATDYVMTR